MENKKVTDIIAQCASVRAADIHPELSLVYDLYMDSMMFTEMICFLEEEFSVTLTEQDVIEWYSVRDIYNHFKQ